MSGPHAAPAEDPDLFGVRPYAMTNGRTKPSTPLDLMSLVRATGRGMIGPGGLTVEHSKALQVCQRPTPVAEIAALLRRPVTVTKVVLSDLIEIGAATARSAPSESEYSNDPAILQAVIDGLRRLV